MSDTPRQRIDLWLFRARLAKTRAAATRLVTEGRVRIVREGASRQIEKASVEIAAGEGVVLSLSSGVLALKVEGLGARRGPPAEARGLYSRVEA